MIGVTYYKNTTPDAIANEAEEINDEDDEYARLSNSAVYARMYSRYSDCLREILQDGYNAALAQAEQMTKAGGYDEGLSSVEDRVGNTLNVNIAKIISIYSVYAGEDAYLPDFRAAATAAKSTLFTFGTEEVIRTEPIKVRDYTSVQVQVYDAPAEGSTTPSSHTETFYTLLDTTHDCADGETVIEQFEEVTVKVATVNDKGVVTGYQETTYHKAVGEPVFHEKGTTTRKGIAVTLNPLDEQKVYDIWPVDLNAEAEGRNMTMGDLIEIYEASILSYLDSATNASVGNLPVIDPIGDAAFDKMAVEINKFIAAQNAYGVTYVYGGDNPYTQMDCSSFVSRVFWFSHVAWSALFPNGTYARHDCRTLYNACVNHGTVFSDPSALRPGDIIFLTNTQGDKYKGLATHVIIYLGNMQTVEMVGSGISLRNFNDRLSSPNWGQFFYAYGRLPEN